MIADSRIVCVSKSKNQAHFAQSGQVFEIGSRKGIANNLCL